MLSPRVQSLFKEEQRQSEIIVAIVQLGISLFVLASYYLTPSTEAAPSGLQPIPVFAGTYAVLTCARLWAVKTRRFPNFLVAVSVVLDVVLLAKLIWFFHIQYRQPPSFYLKTPAFGYFFLFIALRTLRAEIRYIILCGVMAMLCWFGLSWYVQYIEPEAVTQSYLTYLNSRGLLWGAEVDKIIVLGLVTVILSVAAYRSRRLLERAINESLAAQDLSSFFSPEVAQKIRIDAERIKPGEGELKEATIFQMDLRGFTKLSAKSDAGTVMRLIAEYQERVVPIIQRHGGIIDKFMGDGILATFGTLGSRQDFACGALQAMDELAAMIDSWNLERAKANEAPLRVGMAAATGFIIVGAVGSQRRKEFTVIGDAVNLSAKLEKHTKKAQVRALCDKNTYDKAKAQGYTGEKRIIASSPVDGVEAPMELVSISELPAGA